MVKKEVKEFYRDSSAYIKLFNEKKKVSLDINTDYLEFIDKLAKLTSNSRTVIIHALIGEGIFPFLDRLEKMWTGYSKNNKYEKIQPNIQNLLARLKELRKSDLLSK